MSVSSTLGYIAFSVFSILVMIDADGPYIMACGLALLLLNFIGPSKMTQQDLQAEVPKSQYWLLFLFVSVLFFAPFYRVATGIDLLSMPRAPIKIVTAVIWVGLTLLFLRGVVFSSLRNKA